MKQGTYRPEQTSLFPQESVYVLGGGPSLKDFDFSRLAVKFVVGCNDAYKLGDEIVDVLFWGDAGWWRTHRDRVIQRYSGVVVSCNSRARKDDRVCYITRKSRGLANADDSRGIAWNFSSGAASTNLALRFGARYVILLGFDMKLGGDGSANWHPNEVSMPNPNSYNRFLRGFQSIRDALPEKFPESTIINANLDSAMEFFPKMDLEEALKCY